MTNPTASGRKVRFALLGCGRETDADCREKTFELLIALFLSAHDGNRTAQPLEY